MAISRLLARPLLASLFLYAGANSVKNASALAPKAAKVTDKIVPLAQKSLPVSVPSDPSTLVRVNGAAQVVAGLALATGRAPRLSSGVLAASLVPTTLAGHAFWDAENPEEKKAQLLQFLKNTSLLGGLLIAAGDTEGKPGVAWRARRAAKDARREAKQLAVSAKREAKLAKAQLT